MRTVKLLTLLLAAFSLTFVACNDDDDDPIVPVEISNVEISDDNSTITVTFNQAVYGNAEKTEALGNDAFELTITSLNQDTASFSVVHSAGDAVVTINLVFESEPDGDETITVNAKANMIFGENGNALTTDISEMVDVNSSEIQIAEFSLSDDNQMATITFNQAVYKTAGMSGDLDNESFDLSFTGENEVNINYTVDHSAGDKTAQISIEYLNRVDADQMLEVSVVTDKIFNTSGETTPSEVLVSMSVNDLGIIGKWSAYDISKILADNGFDDSLYANFYADQSYLVTAFLGGLPFELSGTYEMTKTEIDDIWEITLEQASPSALTSNGIFKVFPAAQDSMWYEVAQIDPVIPGVTPPTAEEGFGSTSGGLLGTDNVQKYYWIGQE